MTDRTNEPITAPPSVSDPTKSIAMRAEALRNRIEPSAVSPFVRRIVQAAEADCDSYEFNVWHANADNVKSNGGDRAWGTQGPRRQAPK